MPNRFRAWVLTLALVFGATGYNCGAPPSITITSPTHGTFHVVSTDGLNVTVDGQLNCLSATGVEVRLWWNVVGTDPQSVLATVQPSTLWSATMPIPQDGRVLNTIIAEVRYGPMLSLSRRHSVVVHVVQSTANVGTGDNGTTIVRVTDEGLDALEPSISTAAAAAFDLNAMLQWTDLTQGTEPCVVPGPLGTCVVRVLEALVTNATYDDVDVALDATASGIETDVQLQDVLVDFHVVGRIFGVGFTCDANLTSTTADLDVLMDLEQDTSDPGKILVVQDGPIGLAPPPIVVDAVSCAGVVGGWLGNFVQGMANNAELGDSLGSALTGLLGGTTALEDGFQDALDQIALEDAIGTALEMDLDATLIGDPSHNASGISIVAGVDPQPTSNACSPGKPLAGQPWACAGLPDEVHVVTSGGQYWGWDDQTPSGATFDAALGLEDTALNLLLRAVAEQGKLSQRVDKLAGCSGANLTWDCLIDAAGCAALGLSCSDRVDILVRPTVAPLVRGNPGPGGSTTDLIFQLELEFVTPGFNYSYDIPRLSMMLTFESGLDVVVDNGELGFAFTLCDPQPCTPTIEIHAIYAAFPNQQIGPRLIDAAFIGQDDLRDAVVDLLEDSLASSIQGFPLPSIQGQPLLPISVEREGIPPCCPSYQGFITVFGDL